MEHKTCTACNVTKPLNDFYPRRRNGKEYYPSTCKICESKMKYEKRICECGRTYTYAHYRRHLRSKLHNRLMAALSF